MAAVVRAVVVGRAWGQLGSILVPCGAFLGFPSSGVDLGATWACLVLACGGVEYPWGLLGPSRAQSEVVELVFFTFYPNHLLFPRSLRNLSSR